MRLRRRGRSSRPGARSLVLRADRPHPSGPPSWTVLTGPGPVHRIDVSVGPAGAGTRVTVAIATTGRLWLGSDRRRLTATARLLLGLIDSTARAPRLVVAAAITRTGPGRAELLVGRCRSGEWELPGGKVEPRESEAEALRREIDEELGVRIVVGGRVGEPVDLGDGLQLRALAAHLEDGEPDPQAREHTALRWIAADELQALPWRAADRDWVPALTEMLTVT
ncbi:NUDIX domain-containing protein [Nakamurella flava]|uniref:8-oxo-dGTP diphosphatase n=2 Tax=Nakamurella flava TaxID=2576308 RepID=A0A4U6QPW5_9ACTN|nr:NUDIX domain-containing protein [Nakamurella flava]